MPVQTGIVADRRFCDHDMGAFHVESPRRMEAILDLLEDRPHPEWLDIAPRPALEEEIRRVHSPGYFLTIQNTAGKERVALDPDTATSALSFETALLAAGGLIELADRILDGGVRNGFAAVRPPGHHAERDRAMGFCLFNNIAVAAGHLLEKRGLDRILIVDWDLHHGNGTQNTFYRRRDVLYFSIHQAPLYPGTGSWRETGEGPGEGFNLNLPLSPGKGDEDYLYILRKLLAPAAEAFAPDFILVSAGFDIAASDPLGGMEISTAGFGAVTRELAALAERCCSGRLAHVLEGGYDLAALRKGVERVLIELSGGTEESGIHPIPSPLVLKETEPALEHWKKWWPLA
jgi:acetoin utilization deacetylase AcuC-like enzyme